MSTQDLIVSAYHGYVKSVLVPTGPSDLSIFTDTAADKGFDVQNFPKYRPKAKRFIADFAFEVALHGATELNDDIRYCAGIFNVLFLHLGLKESGFPEKCEPPRREDTEILVVTEGGYGIAGFYDGQEHENGKVLPNSYNDKPPELGGYDSKNIGQPGSFLSTAARGSDGMIVPIQKLTEPKKSKVSDVSDEPIAQKPTDKKDKKQPTTKTKLSAQERLQLIYKQRQEAKKVEQDKPEQMKELLEAVSQEESIRAERGQEEASQGNVIQEANLQDAKIEPVNLSMKVFYKKKAVIEKIATMNLDKDVNTTQRDYWTQAFIDLFPDMSRCECAARVAAMEAREVTVDNKTPWDVKWHSYVHVRDALACRLDPQTWMSILIGLSKGCELFRDVVSEIQSESDASSVARQAPTKSVAHPTSVLQQSTPSEDVSSANPFSSLKANDSPFPDTYLKAKTAKQPNRQYIFGKNMHYPPGAIKSQKSFPFSKNDFNFNLRPTPASQEITPANRGPPLIFSASNEVARPVTGNIFARAALHRPGSEFLGFASSQSHDQNASAPFVFAAGSISSPPPKPDESLIEAVSKPLPVFDVPKILLPPFWKVPSQPLYVSSPLIEPAAIFVDQDDQEIADVTSLTLQEKNGSAHTEGAKKNPHQEIASQKEVKTSEMSKNLIEDVEISTSHEDEDISIEEDIHVRHDVRSKVSHHIPDYLYDPNEGTSSLQPEAENSSLSEVDEEVTAQQDDSVAKSNHLVIVVTTTDAKFEDDANYGDVNAYEYLAQRDYDVDAKYDLSLAGDELLIDVGDVVVVETCATPTIRHTSKISDNPQIASVEDLILEEHHQLILEVRVEDPLNHSDDEPHYSSDQVFSSEVDSNDTYTTTSTPDPNGNGPIESLVLKTWSHLRNLGDEQDNDHMFVERLKKLMDGLQQLQVSRDKAKSVIEPSLLHDVDTQILAATLHLDDHFNNNEGDGENLKTPLLTLSLEPLEDLESWSHATFDNAFRSPYAPPEPTVFKPDQADFRDLFNQEPLFGFLSTLTDRANSDDPVQVSALAADKPMKHEATLLEQLEHMSLADILSDTGGDAQAPKEVAPFVEERGTKQNVVRYLKISSSKMASDPPLHCDNDSQGSQLGENPPPYTPLTKCASFTNPESDDAPQSPLDMEHRCDTGTTYPTPSPEDNTVLPVSVAHNTR
ncbi:Nn.00g007250.m01.CDS01 [Neocucurbitaria sp. VM-36]